MEPWERDLAEWRARGSMIRTGEGELFVVDRPGDGEPVVILHGFPTCSFDWRAVIDQLPGRRVVALDLLGYGLSDKPLDHRYSLFAQADAVASVLATLGVTRGALVTHDVGDSVGGEVLARALDGTIDLDVTARVITNGSIYMDLVQLSPGQQLLLSLPDEVLPSEQAPNADVFMPGLASTFGPATQPDERELRAQWALVERGGGNRILPRLIRYIEERRIHEGRWTGAIEKHPSPLAIVWGDADPIAVWPMAERLAEMRTDATLIRLDGIGHYPMIEAPELVASAITTALSG